MKARTLLLMCGLSLAGAWAAERIAPLHGARGQARAAEPTWAAVEPVKDNGGAAMPPVSVMDAGDGRVQIEAHDASVAQILAALQASGLIRLSGSDQLSRTVSGTYTGTLPQVLSRILDGYSYFLRVTASGTELHAVGASRNTDAARSASGDATAPPRSGVANVEAATPPAPAPAPPAAFALSAANPVSKARARERALRSARTR